MLVSDISLLMALLKTKSNAVNTVLTLVTQILKN